MKFFKSKLFVWLIGAAVFVTTLLLLLLIPFCRHGGFEAQEAVYRAGEHGRLRIEQTNGEAVSVVSFDKGKSRDSVIAIPDDGYEFVMWSDGKTDKVRRDDFNLRIDVTAHFKIKEYTVEYVFKRGGYIISEGGHTQKVPHGENAVAVTAVAEYGYEFVQWSDGVKAQSRCETNVRENKTITAEFAPKSVNQKFVLGDGAYFLVCENINGVMTSRETKELEEILYYDGRGKDLRVYLETGYEFDKWSDGNAVMNRTYYYNESGEPLYGTAKKILYKAEYSASTGGYIEGKTFQETYYGEQATSVTAIPLEGYKFVRWSDGKPNAERTDLIEKNLKVMAEFEKIEYTVRYSAGEGGYINGRENQIVTHGNSTTEVTAVPESGYAFVCWSDGVTEITRSDSEFNEEITVFTATFTDLFAGGNGTPQLPFVISRSSQFMNMRRYPNANYVLTGDVNGRNIKPVFDSDVPFEGNFDGRGYAIKDCDIYDDPSGYASLFGYVGQNATISCLKIEGLRISFSNRNRDGEIYAGALAGVCLGTVHSVNVSATINIYGNATAKAIVGGMAGKLFGDARNCTTDVNIRLTEHSSVYVGGFAGKASGNITSCESKGEITLRREDMAADECNAVAGGFIGEADENSAGDYSSHSSVNITSEMNACVGGFIGITRAAVRSSHATGNVITEIGKAGGFIGKAESAAGGIIGCYANGNVSGTDAGGFAETINIASSDKTVNLCYATGVVVAEKDGSGFCNNITAKTVGCYAMGNVTSENASGFANIFNGEIRQCGYSGQSVSGKVASGFISNASGTVERCYSHGTVTAHAEGVGFVNTSNAEIKNCYSQCDILFEENVSGDLRAAGIAVENGGGIVNCYFSGKISVSASSAITAYGIAFAGDIYNCHWLYYNNGAAQNGYAADSDGAVDKAMKYEIAEDMYFLADTLNEGQLPYWKNIENNFPIVR